jgi:hypothetical protein
VAQADSTWSRGLDPAGNGIRLVICIGTICEWHELSLALLSVFLIEFRDFAMMRRMLKGSGAELRCRRLAQAMSVA